MTRPIPSSDVVRRRMERQGRRDTKPELELRRLLWSAGLRYRVDIAPIKGTRRRADIVFTRAKVAVFVDGCFWHRCPMHATAPKNNSQWWENKLAANVTRDRDTDRQLSEAGWLAIRVWEHEDLADAAERIKNDVWARRGGRRNS